MGIQVTKHVVARSDDNNKMLLKIEQCFGDQTVPCVVIDIPSALETVSHMEFMEIFPDLGPQGVLAPEIAKDWGNSLGGYHDQDLVARAYVKGVLVYTYTATDNGKNVRHEWNKGVTTIGNIQVSVTEGQVKVSEKTENIIDTVACTFGANKEPKVTEHSNCWFTVE